MTLKDVALASPEGHVSVEHLKRYTTLGMATDQGKTANVNGLAAMAALTDRTIGETGTTAYRPPSIQRQWASPPAGVGARASIRSGAYRSRPSIAPRARKSRHEGWPRPAWYGPDNPACN